MLKLEELDRAVSIRDQMRDASPEPVTLVNIFRAAPDQADALIAAWAEDARFFKAKRGFISTQLHRGTEGSSTFLNYAVWESVAAFAAAFGDPAFKTALERYPDGVTGSPHLFRKMAVEGLCVA